MKTLTYWAAKHRKKAVGIMVLLHLVLIFNALYLGKILFDKNIMLNEVFFYSGIAMFVISYFLYPVRAERNSLFKYDQNSKIFKYSFLKHKILDVISSMAAFILIAYVANISYSEVKFTGLFSSDVKAADYQNMSKTQITESLHLFSNNKNLNKNIKSAERIAAVSFYKIKTKSKVHKILNKRNTSTGQNFGGKLALIILLSIAATFGLAMLSCYILCSGFEVAGVILFAGGLTGLIALSIILIKKIIRNRENLKIKNYEE